MKRLSEIINIKENVDNVQEKLKVGEEYILDKNLFLLVEYLNPDLCEELDASSMMLHTDVEVSYKDFLKTIEALTGCMVNDFQIELIQVKDVDNTNFVNASEFILNDIEISLYKELAENEGIVQILESKINNIKQNIEDEKVKRLSNLKMK